MKRPLRTLVRRRIRNRLGGLGHGAVVDPGLLTIIRPMVRERNRYARRLCLLLEVRNDRAQVVSGLVVLPQVVGEVSCQSVEIALVVRFLLIDLQRCLGLRIALGAAAQQVPGLSSEVCYVVRRIFAHLCQGALGDNGREEQQVADLQATSQAAQAQIAALEQRLRAAQTAVDAAQQNEIVRSRLEGEVQALSAQLRERDALIERTIRERL